jgi:hypothetical protein
VIPGGDSKERGAHDLRYRIFRVEEPISPLESAEFSGMLDDEGGRGDCGKTIATVELKQ